jgi:hypothetical protein
VLAQAVLHARQRGWLAVYIPNGWQHAQCGPYIEPISQKDKLFDNSTLSTSALRGLLVAHGQLLRSFPIQETSALKKYTPAINYFRDGWNRALKVHGKKKHDFLSMRAIVLDGEQSPIEDELDKPFLKDFDFLNFEPKTLEDYILLGLAIGDLAGFAFTDLVHELRMIDSVPVLFAVDEYNAWEAISAFSFNNVKVHARDLAVPRALSFLDKKKSITQQWTVKNGLCIAATAHSHPEGRDETFNDVLPSIPLCVRMPTYNHMEFLSAVSYYLNFAPVDPTLSYEDVLQFRMHTASTGLHMRQQAVPFMLPRMVRTNEADFRWAMMTGLSERSDLADEDWSVEAETEDLKFADEDEDEAEDEAEAAAAVVAAASKKRFTTNHPDVLVNEL